MRFFKLEDSFLVSIVINGLPPYYMHFLESLKIIDKLSSVTFDSLSELLSQHSKSFGKQKQIGEDLLFTKDESSKGRGKSNFGNFQNQCYNRSHGQGTGHRNFNKNKNQSNPPNNNAQSGRGMNFNPVRYKRCL